MNVEDLGQVALLPGFVNAHTHLEFSHLDRPLGQPGIALADWIRLVMATRRLRSSSLRPPDGADSLGPFPAGERVGVRGGERNSHDRIPSAASASAVALGLAESTRLGVTTLADIAQPGWSPEAFDAAPLEAMVFLELIAPVAERIEAAMQLARTHLAATGDSETPRSPVGPIGNRPPSAQAPERDSETLLFPCQTAANADRPAFSDRRLTLGLSPHAPYSVHPVLLRQLAALSAARNVPLAFHLAESPEEIELLRSGAGPLRQLLEDLGVWEPSAIARGTRPLDYLRIVSAASRTLVIHGNYLDDAEIEFLAGHRDRMAVVYCPRTHAWFGHAEYPLARMLASGVTVALGTDSRASSPDLSILAEIREAAGRHPEVDRPVILELATLRAARALGRESEIGSLEPGKRADLAVVALSARGATDPYGLLFDAPAAVVATWFCGYPVDWSSSQLQTPSGLPGW
jgi:cytosine/adenosine deaminase-related metal-dependent hydrolase